MRAYRALGKPQRVRKLSLWCNLGQHSGHAFWPSSVKVLPSAVAKTPTDSSAGLLNSDNVISPKP